MPFPKFTIMSILVVLITFTLTYVILAPYYTTPSSSIPSQDSPSTSHDKPELATDHDDNNEVDDDATTTPCDPSLLPISLSPDFPLNITHHKPDLPILPPSSSLPLPHTLSDSIQAIPLLLSLTRSSKWSLIAKIPLQGDTHEPEGLLRLTPNRYLLSAGEYTAPTVRYPADDRPIRNGTDRTPGAGYAHLLMYDQDGTLVADASISLPDAIEYHNGGIDYDGREVWGVLSQYRPNTSATVYAADPETLRPRAVIHHPSDHLGAVAINPFSKDNPNQHITTLNWGGRTASKFLVPSSSSSSSFSSSDDSDNNSLPSGSCVSRKPHNVKNPSHFIDYQDCKYMGPWDGRTLMLCSGVASLDQGTYDLGGIALVDIDTMLPVAEIPITLKSDRGVSMTQNPMDISIEDGKLRFYWVPDQHNSTLYIYEAQP